MTLQIDVVVGDQRETWHYPTSQGTGVLCPGFAQGKFFSCHLPDRLGRTPSHWAVEKRHINVVLALHRAEASVDHLGQRANSLIMLAASRGHVGIVGVLFYYRPGEEKTVAA